MDSINGEKKYWWRDTPDGGFYEFCYNEKGSYDFTVYEVDVHYNYGWTEEKRQRRFKGAKFIFGGCSNGCSYDRILKAETIEDAKREFEGWYEQYLSSRIEGLKKALETTIEDYELFMKYKQGIGGNTNE